MSRNSRADGFLVLRTPLLPFDLLEGCSASAEAPRADDDSLDAALARDRAEFTARLGEILERPEVGDALRLASPDLAERLEAWVVEGTEPDAKLVRAALRYVARMCARPTPFGLMAGTTLGSVGQRTALALGPRTEIRRRTTVDPIWRLAFAFRGRGAFCGAGGQGAALRLLQALQRRQCRAVRRRSRRGARWACRSSATPSGP